MLARHSRGLKSIQRSVGGEQQQNSDAGSKISTLCREMQKKLCEIDPQWQMPIPQRCTYGSLSVYVSIQRSVGRRRRRTTKF